MRIFVGLSVLLMCVSSVAYSDDADRYKAAKFYKTKVMKVVNKSSNDLSGDCRLMLTMHHVDNRYAKLKRIRSTGNTKLCRMAVKALKPYRNKNVAYDEPEKLLRINISVSD